MLKKFIILGLMILVFIVGGFFYIFSTHKTGPEYNIHEFGGTIKSAENNRINIYGRYISSESLPEDVLIDRDLNFRIDEYTSFKKTEIHWPDLKELKKDGATSGTFSLSDLSRTESEGSFKDFQESLASYGGAVYVKVYFKNSVYKSKNPIASSIYYEIMISPF